MSLIYFNIGYVSVLKWLNVKGDIFLIDRFGGIFFYDVVE